MRMRLLNIRGKIMYELSTLFLQHKTFIGRYADNAIEMRKFVSAKNIMVVHVEYIGKIGKLDFNLRNTSAAKTSKAIMYFVHDNMITRWLNWRPSKEHFDLLGIEQPDIAALKSDFVKEFMKRHGQI